MSTNNIVGPTVSSPSEVIAEQRKGWLGKCHTLIGCRSILSALDGSLRTSGFSGNTGVSRLIYLASLTRIVDHRPVSVLLKGPSSSGKSFALESALRYVPDHTYEMFSGMSEKFLIYSGLDLRHRFLIIQEAAGLREGDGRAFLRQLMTEGEVRYGTVQSTKDGNEGKELPKIKGPVGIIMTTTANKLHAEDETRFISLQMDESSERTRQALLRQVTPSVAAEPEVLDAWHALHDYICSSVASVSIPFAENLARSLPLTHFRVLRDFPQVLKLISAHTLLHQVNRASENGQLVATLEDYDAVHELVSDALSEGLETTVTKTVREVVEAVEAQMNHQGTGFSQGVSQRAVAELLARDQSVISRTVHRAIDDGYLVNQTSGQGRQATLILGERKLPAASVLPSPQQLRDLVAEACRAA